MLVLAAVLAIPYTGASAQGARPALQPEEYGQFESIAFSPQLSPDGRWLAYGINRVNDTTELRIRRLDRDSTRTIMWASGPRYSADSRWLAWSVGVSPDERARLSDERKPVRLRAGLLSLTSGDQRRFDSVSTIAFDATGRFLALLGYAPDEPKGKGADLRVLDLAQGAELTFGNVGEFVWSDTGSRLAFTVATGAAAGNGVQLYDGSTGRISSLDSDSTSYSQLAWREGAPDLAVLRSVSAAGKDGDEQVLLAWRGLHSATPDRRELNAGAGIDDTLMISASYRPRWSDDGRIAFGLRPLDEHATRLRRPTDAAGDSSDTDSTGRAGGTPGSRRSRDASTVQIWHSSDVRVIPQQQVQANARGRRTLLAVWDPSSARVVRAGSSLDETAQLMEGWRHAMERTQEPYAWGEMFGRRYHDLWTVNLATGERTRMLDSVRYSWPSGAGRYVLSFDGTDYWTVELATGTRRNITSGVPAVFADTAYDTPTDMRPPFGQGGWLHGDAAVLLYDEHDIWRVAPDGSGATRITDGATDRLRYRVVRVDTHEPTLDPAADMYMSLHGLWSQQRGYAVLRPGASRPEHLLLADRNIGQLAKADSADVFMWREEARDDSPDLFVGGPTLANGRQVTNTNPFMRNYAWTRMELVEYHNESGTPLQGVLLYPANHDPTRAYPMIVYAYERLAQQAHSFQAPSERSYYNFTAWTQNGYFVLLPDIVFRAREPGVSLLENLRPAVGAVVERGLVDAARVGFIGHSWGGYHATYVATHSNLFAASVAGAAITDLVSFMGQFHWNTGTPESDHSETGQARMEVPFWEDPEAHVRNSPIHNVHNMTTPLLMAHGDDDGVVEFFQATEFYNFARRAGKPMVLLVYGGEDHGFTQRANQVDYHRRILEWFGHHLKGEAAPAWMTDGVMLDQLDDERKRVAGPDTGSRR